MSIELVKENFNVKSVLEEVAEEGAATVRVLSESTALHLAREIHRLHFQLASHWIDLGDFDVLQDVPQDSPFGDLRDSYQGFMQEELRRLAYNPFKGELVFHGMELVMYRGSELRNHTDQGAKNLICAFTFEGEADFCFYPREGVVRKLRVEPGIVTLMRAPGLNGVEDELSHGVKGMHDTRSALILRQNYFVGG